MRDPKTEEFKELIGQGAKVKMDESGNILLKRLSSSQVFVKNAPEVRIQKILSCSDWLTQLTFCSDWSGECCQQ